MTIASASPSRPMPASGTAGTVPSRAAHRPTGGLSERSTSLLEDRGLDVCLCSQIGIESASSPDGGDDWIAIPYVRAGAAVNHKYRRVVKRENAANFAQDKGGGQCWWNFDAITDPSLADCPLVITEGELDGITALQCGFARTVSVPGGAPQQETSGKGKYGFIADTLDLLRPIKQIVLAVDGDQAGVALLGDLAKRLGRGRCRYVTYPIGCKDLNDVLVQHGPVGVAACIDQARWLAVPGLYRMSELPPVDDPQPYVSGIPGMGGHYQLRLGDFAVVTGIPGSGKSTFVNDLACRMANRYGWSICFASPEQSPQTDHRRALRTWLNRKPEADQSASELLTADTWIDQHFSFVVPGDDDMADLEWLLDKLASAVVRYDSKLIIIDPWNELDHAKPKDMTMTEYVGRAIRELKKFAKAWHVHLIVVAHPAKISRNKDGSTPVPTLYDISDSAHWYNKTDVGLIIHPKKSENGGAYTAVCIQKSRYHDKIGTPGEVALLYIPQTGRFEATH